MAFGVVFTQGTISGDPHRVTHEILEQAEAADRLGYSAALTTEHKYSAEYFGSPLHMAYAIAARTERVKVGTSIAIAPLYNPMELAQDAAMLDQLSGGRLWLGLGAGYLPEDFQTVGVPFEGRGQRFDETVRIIRQGWTEERFSFAGKVYDFSDVSVIPKPVQSPPPLHLGAWTPGGLARAGRIGDGWITNALMSVDTMRTLGDMYRASAAEHGRTPKVTAIRFCWTADSREEAVRDFGATALDMVRTLFTYGAITDMPGVTSAEEITLEDAMRDRMIFGTPDECAAAVEQYKTRAQVDDLLLIFRHPSGPAQDRVLAAMELFGTEVIPRFVS